MGRGRGRKRTELPCPNGLPHVGQHLSPPTSPSDRRKSSSELSSSSSSGSSKAVVEDRVRRWGRTESSCWDGLYRTTADPVERIVRQLVAEEEDEEDVSVRG